MCTQGFQLSLSFGKRTAEFLIPYCGKGGKNAHAKLDNEKVRRIKSKPHPEAKRYSEKAAVLSKELGVCIKQIYNIRRGLAWSHIK